MRTINCFLICLLPLFLFAQKDITNELLHIQRLHNAKEMDTAFQILIKKSKIVNQNRKEFDEVKTYIAMSYILEGNIHRVEHYINSLLIEERKGSEYYSLARIFFQNNQIDMAEKYLQLSLKNAKKYLKDFTTDLDDGMKPASVIASASTLLSNLYMQQGNHIKAITVLDEAIPMVTEKNGLGLQQLKADLLVENGEDEQALNIYLSLLQKGNETKVLLGKIQSSYERTSPLGDFELFIQERIASYRQSFRDNLKSKLIKIPAPNFSLKDILGQTVTLSELRGKIVVLDFWAMWCAPCKASFPAMQLAVDQHKDDQAVVFLFIDTWENGQNMYQEVTKYMEQHNYRFNILFDTYENKDYSVVNSYGIKGLPEKVFIDKEGFIRYKLTGFSGNNVSTIGEINDVIQVLK